MASFTHLRRSPVARGALALAVLAASLLSARAAGASAPTEEPAELPVLELAALAPIAPDVPGAPHIARDLTAIVVDSTRYRVAADEYTTVATSLQESQRRRRDAVQQLSALKAARERLDARHAAVSAREAAVRTRYDAVVLALHEIIIEAYIGSGNPLAEVDGYLDPKAANNVGRKRALADATSEYLQAEEERLGEMLRDAVSDRRDAESQLADVARDITAAAKNRDTAASEQVERADPVMHARTALEVARATATVDGGDFSLVALDAYRRASVGITEEAPACLIDWWGLAGISRVEGHHGTYGRSMIDEFGSTSPKIIGIALNGERETRVIGDTDDGTLDGDQTYDRAVGPMQFIPSTWRRWAADGNGDGVEDPHNLYDATLAAARYLCRSSTQLTTDAGLQRAYFSYNHSEAYVTNVLGWARRYQQLGIPRPGEPIDRR